MEGSKKTVAEYVWPGRITQVIDPHYFWMQLGTRENLYQFEQLQCDMHLFAQQSWAPATSTEELEPGMVVLVDTGTDDMTRWKRGQVAGIMHGNSVDVFYVDYGNTELTTVDKICTNVPTPFKACPPQAVRCSLAAIKPLVKSWTSRGTKTFQMLTNDRLLSVLVLYGEPGYCEVALYPSAEENGKSVAHCLLAEEVAMPIEDHMVPEFLQDIPTFMTHGCGDISPYTESPPSTRHDDQKPETDAKVISTPPSSEKYIPPHQKNQGSSPGSAGSSLTNQSISVQNTSSTSGQKYSNFPAKHSPQMSQSTTSACKTKEPVIDFFPFDNVSVYPPSPSSPIKSPTRTGSYGRHEQGHNGSYFSRSPSKYEQYGSSNGYRQGHGDDYSVPMTNKGKGDNRLSHPGRQHERNRFAANFDNLPAPSNTFEPDYLYQQTDRPVENPSISNTFPNLERTQSESGLQRSANTSASSGDYGQSPRVRPKLNISDSSASQSPFYPPQQKGEHASGYAAPRAWTLTPPRLFEQSHSSPPNLSHELNPPGFYHTHMPPPPLNQSGQYYNQSGPPVPLIKQNSSTGIVSSSPIKVPLQSEFDSRNNHPPINMGSPYQDQYHKDGFRHNYVSPPNVRPSLSDQDNKLNKNSNHQGFSKTPVKIALPSPSKYQGYEPPNMSPESPESPAIAAFNLGDLEYTQMTSTDHFHQWNHQKRLQALNEEAEDIARESKEQSELVAISRYGARGQSVESVEDCVPASNNGDIFDQIAQEIQYTSKHSPKGYEELKKSPIRKIGKDKEEYPVNLEGIPQSYIADINFTDAVKEALEFGKTDGMENARALLDGVVESLKLASVEQLYDVLLLMLTKAVKEYNLYYVIIMETINTLNGELEIRDCLARALKKQLELCVRVPMPHQPLHLDCARVMAHVYNMSLDWSDSSSIQDGILVTVEKWIVFNNKGTQIGQADKENVFLDCFGAFWEVAGTPLVQHNQTFRSRIKDEVRKKLLNEAVSRCIRERLLDIMVDLFSLNVQKVDVYTQTLRRTMIPSSCQVRPTTCDKATFMASVWQDEGFENINVDSCTETNWLVNPEYASPDPVLNLRPGGRSQGPIQKTNSIPQDSCYSTKAIDTPNLQDLSIASDIAESIFVTPVADTLVCNTDQEKPKLSELINPINEGKSSISKSNLPDENKNSLEHSIIVKDMETYSAFNDTTEMTKDYDNVKDNKKSIVNQSCNVIHKTSAKQKSATGKSLVDWFDYEPTGEDSVRLEEKRLETRKKLEHTSREFIENDVALKYAPSKDAGRKKSKKEKEREKKMVKAAALSTEKPKSVGEKVTDKGEHEIEHHVVCESQTDMNNETVARGNQVDRYTENKVDETIDWWGIGETPDPRYLPGGIEETLGSNIYIDNGPDVIIEEESELFNDLETVAILGNIEVASELVGTRDLVGNVEESNVKVGDCTSNSSEEQEIGENKLLIRQTGDEFAFDLDDDDEWDSASSEDLNVNSWLGLQQDNPDYLKEFPNNDLKTVVHSKSDIPTLVTEGMLEAGESDAKYEKNFPKTNFGDFVKLKDEPEERPQTTRWVPGKRKCHNCHSEDHTTESCKDFVIIQ